MKRQSDLPTLASGIAWLSEHLDELADIPYRLHDHAVGDKDAFGAPRFSGAFWHRLVGSAFSFHEVKTSMSCHHPQLPPGGDPRQCDECYGIGVKDVTRDEYDKPLSAAMVALSHEPAPSTGTPQPIAYIVALLVSGMDIDQASRRVGIPIVSADHRLTVEAMFLRSIRKLYGRFRSGPVGRRDISDAQADAEAAA